ncbi:MAG: S-methyl-5'-thioadenosine phosphorylase [Anaerolineales bacterium]
MTEARIAVIGGSGLYQMAGLEVEETRTISTPFGEPSAPIVIGRLSGQPVAFLARHGLHHQLSPSEVNYRANIFALKLLGVERVISVSACGSLREDYAPGHLVVPDQLLDFTRLRPRTFFEGGIVAHVSVADPFCPVVSQALVESATAAGGIVHPRGSFLTIEGPRFSTRAESNTFRGWGVAIIGMTSSPEAFLAREAEMCYAVLAHVTDYDVWHRSEAPVTVEMVIRTLKTNTRLAEQALADTVARLPVERDCLCKDALKDALITAPDSIPPETLERLRPLVRRYYS